MISYVIASNNGDIMFPGIHQKLAEGIIRIFGSSKERTSAKIGDIEYTAGSLIREIGNGSVFFRPRENAIHKGNPDNRSLIQKVIDSHVKPGGVGTDSGSWRGNPDGLNRSEFANFLSNAFKKIETNVRNDEYAAQQVTSNKDTSLPVLTFPFNDSDFDDTVRKPPSNRYLANPFIKQYQTPDISNLRGDRSIQALQVSLKKIDQDRPFYRIDSVWPKFQ